MLLYRSLFGLAALTTAIFAFYFFVGLADGSVSSVNLGLWALILGGLGAVLVGGVLLHRRGRTVWSKLVLAVVAVPALLGGLFFLILLLTVDRWN
ncbi:hypothetical protein [Falsiroseomonas oryziterrae]|uniref:hypothetical protein n=1 Tax=Falsiroseomonas oryziterrae TaxID=2911368 RepID=UPI001F25342A|nr:hypothetical protein [Roseomonas sp. NPKOSM-4]